MCDSVTASLIEEVAEQKVRNGELFTAFDVTLSVQDCLKKKNIFDASCHRHRHLKDDVHRAVESHVTSGRYLKNLQDVGAPSNAFVYYPQGGDPSLYVPLARNDSPVTPVSNDPYTIAIPTKAVVPSVPALPSADDNVGDGLDYGRKPDNRGTLTVPANLLRVAGFQHNDSAYVIAGKDANDKPQLTVAKSATTFQAVYTVDICVNVRINKSVLDYAGFAADATYDFEGQSDSVIVRSR